MSVDAEGYGFPEHERTLARLIDDIRVLSPAGVERAALGWDLHVGKDGLILGLTLQNFPDDYIASYAGRVRALDRGAINEDIRTKFPPPPLTFMMLAPSAEGLGADCVIRAPEEIARCE